MRFISTIAWPSALFLIAVFFMVLFRESISSFIGRAKRVDNSGVEAFKPNQNQSFGDDGTAPAREKDEEPESKEPIERHKEEFQSSLVIKQEKRIENDLKEQGFEDTNTINKALKKSLAATQLSLLLFQVETNIMRNQTRTLEYLNGKTQKIKKEDVRPEYEAMLQNYETSEHRYSFGEWLGFMESYELIDVQGQHIVITERGKGYLKWRIETGRRAV